MPCLMSWKTHIFIFECHVEYIEYTYAVTECKAEDGTPRKIVQTLELPRNLCYSDQLAFSSSHSLEMISKYAVQRFAVCFGGGAAPPVVGRPMKILKLS